MAYQKKEKPRFIRLSEKIKGYNPIMFCYRKVTEDLYQIGGCDRRLSLFEGLYPTPRGISYNSYLLLDEKTVLFDTVDKAVSKVFFESLKELLDGRKLDYIVIHHMEPDHSEALADVLSLFPEAEILCSQRAVPMIRQFFDSGDDFRISPVAEGDKLCAGAHTFEFLMAPMVHWPEVMMSYESESGILFSADAFGIFGDPCGALFADEVDFEKDYLDEARRYYANIVGKFGAQVSALLKKLDGLTIKNICPLHGFVWRKDHKMILDKYFLWSGYIPEEEGALICYGSVYGHTANAADILACELRKAGVKTAVYDLSVTDISTAVSECFRYSHLIFASPTYNSGIFPRVEELLRELSAHNLQNRAVCLIENGSWAPQSERRMKEILSECKNITFIEKPITIKSALKKEQRSEFKELAGEIALQISHQPVE